MGSVPAVVVAMVATAKRVESAKRVKDNEENPPSLEKVGCIY